MRLDTKTLNALLATLNQIEVKGKQNLDRLLACIQTLERMKEEAENDGAFNEQEEDV